MTIEDKPTPYDILDTFDDDLWVELIIKSPNSIKLICIMLSLDLQIEKEYITLDWIGLYNIKTSEREFTKNPFSSTSNDSSIKLNLCL